MPTDKPYIDLSAFGLRDLQRTRQTLGFEDVPYQPQSSDTKDVSDMTDVQESRQNRTFSYTGPGRVGVPTYSPKLPSGSSIPSTSKPIDPSNISLPSRSSAPIAERPQRSTEPVEQEPVEQSPEQQPTVEEQPVAKDSSSVLFGAAAVLALFGLGVYAVTR